MDPYAESVKGVDDALRRLNATLESYKIRSGSPSLSAATARSPTPPPPPPPPPPEEAQPKAETQKPVPPTDKPYDDGLARLQAMTSELVRTEPETFARIAKGLLPKEAFELILREMWNLRSTASYPEITNTELRISLNALKEISLLIDNHPYSQALYNFQAEKYLHLGYPDLASGAAYKALLLSDATQDESDEYHERAFESLRDVVRRQPTLKRKDLLDRSELTPGNTKAANKKSARIKKDFQLADDEEVKLWLDKEYEPETYRLLARSIYLCGCYSTAGLYCAKALQLYPQDAQMQQIRTLIVNAVAQHYKVTAKEVATKKIGRPSDWPDQGFVRRELYPWNEFELDRLENLDELNEQMAAVAPKLEIRVVDLPALGKSMSDEGPATVPQLGVFAKEAIEPDEVILDETSLLTANNKLQDALCDACSADLPELDDPASNDTVACPDCDIVFCSKTCLANAIESYHPALCERDVDAIAKDVPPAQAADSLYSLLLLRTLAMAETQDCHPLELEEVQYIWGDFHNVPVNSHWKTVDLTGKDHGPFPKTLPFNFEQNVRLPFHMLEKMDIDIFANGQYDVWVFNTLFAKFRGTASARLSGLGGRAIRGPEVSAVHPMWCMANHNCDPNVSWEWGGSIKFWAKGDDRPVWKGKRGEEVARSVGGLEKDEQVLNHYCDVDLPVKERREWARGALGGDCMCQRCVFEAKFVDDGA